MSKCMKKSIRSMLSGVLILAALSGCGAPKAETNPTTVEQAILFEKAASVQQTMTLPDRFAGQWVSQEGKLTIHADAKVVAEQGTVLPTATIVPRQFDQADVDTLLKVILKGAELYDSVQTKSELQKGLEYVQSPEYHSDPDAPIQSEAELEAHRQEAIAWYESEIAKAPEEKQVIHGFSDSHDPDRISGSASVDGQEYDVFIDKSWGRAEVRRKGFSWETLDFAENQSFPDEQKAVSQADALLKELGFAGFVCDDVEPMSNGILRLYYVPTVNGFALPSIREDHLDADRTRVHYQYWNYGASEEVNPDSITWRMESIQIFWGNDGMQSFVWESPSGAIEVVEAESALLPFERISSIAETMLPVVVIGPTEAHTLVDLDRINGIETRMDVEITKVSLSLMRIRDKGSTQGLIVPVWDFWGTSTWHDADKQPHSFSTQPMLTLNAIDGTVVSRLFGY